MLSARPITLGNDVDAPTQTILNTKTPGRKALKGRSGLQENATHSGAKTVVSKKNVLQTPFRPDTAHGKKPLVSISRPLGDKTPFPNRVIVSGSGGAGKTPGLKLSKLALLAPEPEQEHLSPDAAPLLRPSSTRKTLRGRLSGNFKTPFTKGNYWDVSPGDIGGIGVETECAKAEVDVAVVEDDEIEYMPPTAIEEPYQPLFEMPDYTTLGQSLFEYGHGGCMDDTVDFYYAADIEQQVDVQALLVATGFVPGSPIVERLELPELEDDSPFARRPVPSSNTLAPVKSAVKLTAPPAGASSTRVPPLQTRSLQRPIVTVTQSRPPTRATPTLAPAQTRTTALRAAKAAAASHSITSNSIRAGTSAGARPARPIVAPPAKKATPTTAVSGPRVVRSTSTPSAAAITRTVPPRSGSASSSTPTDTRLRAGTLLGKSKQVNTTDAKDHLALEDSLAVSLEKEYMADAEDFRFEV